jgi:hypothetical protein
MVNPAAKEGESKKISCKERTYCSEIFSVRDSKGNAVEISVEIVWHVENAAKAVFAVDNCVACLESGCVAAVRFVVGAFKYSPAKENSGKVLRNNKMQDFPEGFLPECKEAPAKHTHSGMLGGADASTYQKDKEKIAGYCCAETKSLSGSIDEIAVEIKAELQKRMNVAGVNVSCVKILSLARASKSSKNHGNKKH